ncbi:ATPase [Sphingomonas sp. AP4-R1]|uniref:F0F1 ATP synthase subunit B family protein n=1 Tax=Sphingomonas sp. AP4-R1 TaxID=2735134 RepID=UPI0014933A25|nr:ATPase [Sphingomonas sp. AP4-R1]QJU58697.1 ATPase [Sphingomonas sp. AP4-R1]
MPQIDQIAEIYASQLFWLVIVFALLYFGIGKGMLPKIEKTIEDRDARIQGDLAAAEAARAEADAAEEAYLAKLAESRAAALAETAAAKHKATLDAEAKVKAADAAVQAKAAEAEAVLAAQLADAAAGIETVATEAAQEIVARVSGLNVDRAEAARAVKSALAA